jgi:nucleotide-binding universal stress UspA family protein
MSPNASTPLGTAGVEVAPSPANGASGPIVVGVSASTSSQNALRWAAVEANRRRAELRLVHACVHPQVGYPVQRDVVELLHAEGIALLDRTRSIVRRGHPHLPITTRLLDGEPVNVLRDQSVDAAMTVIGGKKSSLLAEAILGSMATAVGAVSSAPLAVIHPEHPVDGPGRIVVGVDGSPHSVGAIAFAFAEAAIRRVDLLAVHVLHPPALEGNLPDYPSLRDPIAITQEETARLSEALVVWSHRYPAVAVAQEVRRGRTASVLLEHSRSASLLVVGRRPRTLFDALAMGSASRSLVAHSRCPVIIVGPENRSTETDHDQ